MAGSGVALRLHEFKETQDTKNHPTHVPHRQGRDVLGLYPGQIARVHAISSHLDRLTPKTPDMQHYESGAVKKYQRRNFDLLTLQASLQSHHRETHTSNTPTGQSIGADFQKFTLSAHPEPLEQQQRLQSKPFD
ncbi:hypothetical protein G5714_000355 [Onychostoma macrolepis]|uniref:Uncharacterized protein n=1 Tax=Onychostoma macrolepis TaxID=369639 RepID=A0A7J6DHQ6_9TELE|nr:hypothetical protein G5714_000355 [Onychostoma macrolepis]